MHVRQLIMTIPAGCVHVYLGKADGTVALDRVAHLARTAPS